MDRLSEQRNESATELVYSGCSYRMLKGLDDQSVGLFVKQQNRAHTVGNKRSASMEKNLALVS